MDAVAHRLFELPWVGQGDDESRLKKIMLAVLLVTFILGVLMPWIPIPREERQKIQTLPPRLAQLVLEKQKPKPLPVRPEPKVEEKPKEEIQPKEEAKPKEKPKAPAKPEEKPKIEPKAKREKKVEPKIDKVAAARKKAASTGLLAFADDLADLRDEPIISSLKTKQALTKIVSTAETTQRNVLTSGTTGSGGIKSAKLSTEVAGGTVLASRQATQVESSVKVSPKPGPALASDSPAAKPARTYEEVTLVIDKNKGAIFALYNRALRKDPTLQGKVVLEITIAPEGNVTNCKIVSSELNSAELERKLVTRIKLLKFGARDVETLVVTYPIDFLPS